MIRLHWRYLILLSVIIFAFYTLHRTFSSNEHVTRYSLRRLTTSTVSTLCPTVTEVQSMLTKGDPNISLATAARPLRCIVDGRKTYRCLQDDEDVYFPFEKFLKKQFDVSGKLLKGQKELDKRTEEQYYFEWSTSYSKVRYTDETHYEPLGAFGHFASYSVESRDRVRCISAQYGVPMSTQWSPKPYFYPIQIAQYALQHYSRNKTGTEPMIIALGTKPSDWVPLDGAVHGGHEPLVRQQFDDGDDNQSNGSGPATEILPSKGTSNSAVSIQLNASSELDVISFDWKADASASFTIVAEIVQSRTQISLHYVHKSDGRCVWHEKRGEERAYYYELGAQPDPKAWRFMCRDVLVDVSRAITTKTPALGKKKFNTTQLHQGDIRVLSLVLRGHSWIRNLLQRSSAHMELFLIAANWFLVNQDRNGGWSVPVERSIAEKRLVLPAGWYSAMAQGHALSVLTRAYALTLDVRYLKAASKATQLFKINASDGGIRNDLFGNVWYEEYPTQPGTFVLNGFLYSLIGLYDLSKCPLQEYSLEASELFEQGEHSLATLLPLFDTGSGSIYDLRHIHLKSAPNLARWDYHSVHIYLLKWLFKITKVNQLNETANRWLDYAHGIKAKHN